MSKELKFKCPHCDKEYSRPDMFENHKEKCGGTFSSYDFSDRLETKGRERCPQCMDGFVHFQIKDNQTWVCLNCGCHFTPRAELAEIKESLSEYIAEKTEILQKQAEIGQKKLEERQEKLEKERSERKKTNAYGYKV